MKEERRVILVRGDNKIEISEDEYNRNQEFYRNQFAPDKVIKVRLKKRFFGLLGSKREKLKSVV